MDGELRLQGGRFQWVKGAGLLSWGRGGWMIIKDGEGVGSLDNSELFEFLCRSWYVLLVIFHVVVTDLNKK